MLPSRSDVGLLTDIVDRSSVRAVLNALAVVCAFKALASVDSHAKRLWTHAARSLERHAIQKAYGRQ